MLRVRARAFRLFVAALLASLGGAAPAAWAERVSFRTEDGFTLVGDLRPGAPEAPSVILLHMYSSNRGAWAPLVPKLRDAGFTVLAFDQRGHGESTSRIGGELRVAEIPRDEFGAVLRNGVRDVAAAKALLAERGLGRGGLALVGASYGCSVALLASQALPGIGAVALLSPGAAYFGVDVLPAARAFRGPLLGVAAEDDPASARGVRAIVAAHPDPDELVVYPSGGHGTRLFGPRPDLAARVVEFLARSLRHASWNPLPGRSGTEVVFLSSGESPWTSSAPTF